MRIWRIPQIPGILENSSNLRVVFFQFKKFLKCLAIREIPQIPRHLGNYLDFQVFGKFRRFPGIWEISKILKICQITGNLGNLQNTWKSGKCLESGEFQKFCRESEDIVCFYLYEETISRTDEGQPRPKYIFNKYVELTSTFLQRSGPSPNFKFIFHLRKCLEIGKILQMPNYLG